MSTYALQIPTLTLADGDGIGNYIDDYDAELRWLRIALRRAHGLSDPRPIANCLNTTAGGACQGQVWKDPEDDVRRCDRCGRKYDTKADIVRLYVHQRKATA